MRNTVPNGEGQVHASDVLNFVPRILAVDSLSVACDQLLCWRINEHLEVRAAIAAAPIPRLREERENRTNYVNSLFIKVPAQSSDPFRVAPTIL